MSITRVQGNSVNSAGLVTSQAVTLGVGVTLGNLVVVSVACGDNATTITGPAGWTQATINQPNGALATIATSIWYLVVAAGQVGQTSWTWTLNNSHSMYLCIEEWNATNGWPASPVDVSANGDTAGTPTQATIIKSGNAATTAQAEELWIASLAYKGSAQTESSITSGWTKDLEATLANNNTMTMLYNVASAVGAPHCQYTIGSQEYWAGCVVAFKDTPAVTLPGLSTAPTTLAFSATQNGANPASQSDTLSETTGNATAWTSAITYGSGSGWLSISPTSGSLLASGNATITVSCTTGSLAPGTYTATITFTATTGGATATITVSFAIGATGTSLLIGGSPVSMLAGSLLAKSMVGRRGELDVIVYNLGSGGPYGAGLYGRGLYPGGTPQQHFQQYQYLSLFANGGTTPAFTGYITNPAEQKPGFQSLLSTTLTSTDQHYLADKRIVAALYRNKTCGFIVNDLLTNILSQEGVIVGQIATGPVVPIANFGYVSVASALDALVSAASASGVSYYWMIDQNKALWFVPYSAVAGPAIDGTQIDDGRLSGVVPTVTRANPKYRNTQYAAGGVAQTGTNDETQAGDGQKRAFAFSYPLNAAPSIFTLNGSAVTLGIKGQTGYQYYYAVGDPVIAQDSSQTVLVSTDRLRMVYVGQIPTVFTAKNAAQITAQAAIDGTSGIVEAVLTDNTIASSADGLAKCNQQLTQYAMQGLQFNFATRQAGLAQGQQISVTYAPLGFSAAQMLIEEIDLTDQPDGFNLWYLVNAIQGPYDTSWVNFFSNLLQPATIANSINLGVTLNTPLFPSTTLQPSTTLFPS